jgi:hypothetical protein
VKAAPRLGSHAVCDGCRIQIQKPSCTGRVVHTLDVSAFDVMLSQDRAMSGLQWLTALQSPLKGRAE